MTLKYCAHGNDIETDCPKCEEAEVGFGLRKPNKKLKPGDRVLIDVQGISGWQGYGPEATIRSTYRPQAAGARADKRNSDDSGGSYNIRLDGYDYGPAEGNSHTVHWSAINPEPEPDKKEIAAALASIAKAARPHVPDNRPRQERIADVIRVHLWEYPDSFCSCAAYIDGTWNAFADHLAKAVDESLNN